jgi:hypothetical protein
MTKVLGFYKKDAFTFAEYTERNSKSCYNINIEQRKLVSVVSLEQLYAIIEELKFRIPKNRFRIPKELADGQVVVPLHRLLSAVEKEAKK